MVRFHKAKSFKIRGWPGKVTAYPAEKAAREVDADTSPMAEWLRTSSRCGAPGLR